LHHTIYLRINRCFLHATQLWHRIFSGNRNKAWALGCAYDYCIGAVFWHLS
jgi:hypothetical protein